MSNRQTDKASYTNSHRDTASRALFATVDAIMWSELQRRYANRWRESATCRAARATMPGVRFERDSSKNMADTKRTAEP